MILDEGYYLVIMVLDNIFDRSTTTLSTLTGTKIHSSQLNSNWSCLSYKIYYKL